MPKRDLGAREWISSATTWRVEEEEEEESGNDPIRGTERSALEGLSYNFSEQWVRSRRTCSPLPVPLSGILSQKLSTPEEPFVLDVCSSSS